MKQENLKARYRRRNKHNTLTSDFNIKLTNILERNFDPDQPNALWCTDITYIWTQEGFVYLTSVMDLFSKKIIAWELSKNLCADAVVRCVAKAISRRRLTHPAVIHSDRGTQYVSKKYLEVLGNQLIPSYSRKGNPWDNACIESFHALIKREWINFYKVRNYEHAYQIIFEYIETFYNTVRIHGSCNYESPDNYEKISKLESLNLGSPFS